MDVEAVVARRIARAVGGKGFVGVIAAGDAVLLCKRLCAFQMP